MRIDTKALRELLAKATPGPVEYAVDSGAIIGEPNEWLCQFWDKSEEDCPNRDNNGAFVAWLWNNAHAFLRAADRLAALEAENQRLRAELARMRELAAKWRAAPQNPDEPLLAMAADELEAAISQPAEQHDPLAVSDHCGECGEPEPECACDERIEDYRESGQEGR